MRISAAVVPVSHAKCPDSPLLFRDPPRCVDNSNRMAQQPSIKAQDHTAYMQYALSLARQSSPKPTNFCVGAVLVDELQNEIISTGYTLELPGNTHAEQCCLSKFREGIDDANSRFQGRQMNLVLYSTMEPCNQRSPGNTSCNERILQSLGWGDGHSINKVYFGIKEPDIFVVSTNEGQRKLEGAGIECLQIMGMGKELLEVATSGHTK